MKFIKRSRVRERVFVFSVRAAMILLTALICLWMISGAQSAEIKIKRIYEDPIGSSSIVLELDGSISKSQVDLEFDRNFIQISMKGVSGFPAKFQKLTHPELDRVFSYQYQPGLSRARVLLHAAASKWKEGTQWEVEGNNIRLNLSKELNQTAIQKSNSQSSLRAIQLKNAKAAPKELHIDANQINYADSRVVENILKEVNGQSMSPLKNAGKTIDDKISVSSASPGGGVFASSLGIKSGDSEKQKTNIEDQPVFGSTETHASASIGSESKAQGSIVKVIASLLMIIGVIGASGLGFKKYILGKVAKSATKARAIEVVISQSLGYKKSIAIVRVLDQYLVVGTGADGMSLLKDLGSDPKVSKAVDVYMEGSAFTSLFQKTLNTETKESVQETVHKVSTRPVEKPSVRSLIKKRLEEFKPL